MKSAFAIGSSSHTSSTRRPKTPRSQPARLVFDPPGSVVYAIAYWETPTLSSRDSEFRPSIETHFQQPSWRQVDTVSTDSDAIGEAGDVIEGLLEDVYSLARLDDLQGATDRIFETIDRLLLSQEFLACNEILCRVNIQKLPTALMRSFLTITAPAKDKLPARKAFFAQVQTEMIRQKGNEKAQRLLGQLA